MPPDTQIPLKWLVFRHRKDFVAGMWNAYKSNWLPYIHLLPEEEKQEVYNSVHLGVNILNETKYFPPENPTFYRDRKKKLISIRIYDVNYRLSYQTNKEEDKNYSWQTKKRHRGKNSGEIRFYRPNNIGIGST